MKVYRITLNKWSKDLKASGYPGRWNSKGIFVIYTSSSRALASLENVVHRTSEGLNSLFSVIVIDIPSQLQIKEINQSKLPRDWFEYDNYSNCQEIGDQWINEAKYPVLRVPSAIINKEYNFLINPNHKHFGKIKIKKVESFKFDPRIKT